MGRFWTEDRFAEKYYQMTPYQYGANNPLNFIDVNGDSLAIKGSLGNVIELMHQTSQACNCNISTSDISVNGKEFTAQIVGFTSFLSNDPISAGIQNDLKTVIGSSAKYTMSIENNIHGKIDELERYGGAKFDGETKTIKFTDQWVSGRWSGSGMSRPSYLYALNEAGPGDGPAHFILKKFGNTTYAKKGRRYIPFSEGLAHELHHAANHVKGVRIYTEAQRTSEENETIYHINKYRAGMGIPLRGNRGSTTYPGFHEKNGNNYDLVD